jgi:hypothetical protein
LNKTFRSRQWLRTCAYLYIFWMQFCTGYECSHLGCLSQEHSSHINPRPPLSRSLADLHKTRPKCHQFTYRRRQLAACWWIAHWIGHSHQTVSTGLQRRLGQ